MLLVGVVRRPHGLAGELSVEPFTDVPDRFVPGVRVEWRLGGDTKMLTVHSARTHGDRLLIAFEGFAGVDSARSLSGGELSVPDADAAPAPEGWYMSHEIEGWRCEDVSGRFAGTVRLLETTPAGALLSIETPSGKEALVPFVHPIVVLVDESLRRVVIDPPEGLLEV
ncbi:MAG TPA: ribosome maturation factor RimM [Thermoanaerobaculia bacterium]|nr:ribosome maturation factor RimM [Thermoanaerobaculia bacterium]